ncbi:T9SS type A sorting domain-containing protein [bacterium SCSIO 12741]|nr:T9SS type A sorting domain-containing protein [bacterium SCSIO 12741]
MGGIEVWGDNSLSQGTVSNQGQLIIRNQALIENAKEAIDVWKHGHWSTTGGIVNASNSTFRNNWRSAAYYTYHYYSANNPNFEYPNIGKFDNCQFIWNDLYLGTTIGPAISMYNVNGVKVIGCDFEDSRTGNVDRTTGIYTMDAGFLAVGKNLSLVATAHDNFSELNYDICTFKNLKTGIFAMNSNTQNTLVIDHCKFEDCLEGVHLSVIDNPTVTRNWFMYSSEHPGDISSMNQCVLDMCTGFKVEGNLFESEVSDSQTIGVWTNNSGHEQNQIYRNTYRKLRTGNYATGLNKSGLYSGLQWLCNTYESNELHDQYVVGSFVPTTQAGIRYYQGSTDESAGNVFSNIYGNPSSRKHFRTDGDEHYYYLTSTQDQAPALASQNQGNIFIWNTANSAHSCPSSFTSFIVNQSTESMLSAQHVTTFEADRATAENSWTQAVNDLQNLNDAGNSSYLYHLINQVNSSNLNFTQQELISYSPYLSKDIMMEVGKKSNSVFSHNWYKQLIDLNIEVAQDDDFMDFLQTKPNPMPQSLYNQIDQARFTSATMRGKKRSHIADLEGQMTELSDLLTIYDLGHKSSLNWADYRSRITTRGDEVLRSQLADSYLGIEDLSSCSTELQSITSNLQQYPSSMRQEMADFVTFKNYIITLIDVQEGIRDLGTTEYQQLKQYETSLSGRALAQVKNMLCYHFGECSGISTSSSSSKDQAPEVTSTEQELEEEQIQFVLTPNPNSGTFQVSLSNGMEIEEVEVRDVLGKRVELENSEIQGNEANVSILNPQPGTFFGLIRTKNGQVYKTTFVIY